MNKRNLKKSVKEFIKQDINDYLAIEEEKKSFVNLYNQTNISTLSIDKYVIGKGSNTTFCYKLEYALTSLGEIRGATADKYWVYYDANTKTYKTLKRFSSNYSLAFDEVKKEILSIISNAKANNLAQIEKSNLCATVRRKIAYIYNPDLLMPIYTESDLKHFLNCLGISVSKDFIKQQSELLEWKKKCRIQEIVDWSLLKFSKFLYFVFGKPAKNSEKIADELLQEEIYARSKLFSSKLPNNYRDKKSTVDVAGHIVYPRDPKISGYAINQSGFQCEYDCSHKSFVSKQTGKKYLETHHLIPLSNHSKYNISLDIPENIVALCSDCHNCVHYGKDSDKILTKLYNDKIKELNSVGIEIDLKELLKMYKEK